MAEINNVAAIGAVYQPGENEKDKIQGAKGAMEMDDFYKLLAAQMQYQDPSQPMDTSSMMASMMQAQVIQSLSSVTDAVTQMQYSSAITYAASLNGQEVKVGKADRNGNPTGEYVDGVVSGVVLGADPLVIVNGESYHLNQIVGVGELPEKGGNVKPAEKDTSDSADIKDSGNEPAEESEPV